MEREYLVILAQLWLMRACSNQFKDVLVPMCIHCVYFYQEMKSS